MIQSYVLLGTLGVHSVEDLKDQRITVTITLFSGIIGVLLHLFFPEQSIFEMLAGMLTGAGVMLFSRLTKGKIGMGDGIVFVLTGLYLGIARNLMLMCISFLLAGAWGCFLLVSGCGKGSSRIPFVPFLFAGYLLMMIR